VREFHTGPYETVVEPGELLVEVRVPIKPGGASAYEKVERRVGDWAVAAAGAAVRLEGGAIAQAGIALAAVGSEVTSPDAEQALVGNAPSEELFEEAGRLAAAATDPVTDQRGSAEYKRHVAGELTRRALRRATARALREES